MSASRAGALRRSAVRLARTNRYTDGAGRALDGSAPPTDLYTQTISHRAYPSQQEHWHLPAVVGAPPPPHKGRVLLSGGGVVGLVVGSLFALRGWHTSVVERGPALLQLAPPPTALPAAEGGPNTPYDGPLRRPFFSAEHRHGGGYVDAVAKLLAVSPYVDLQYALLTRRALDVLTAAGVRLPALRAMGTVVEGVLDHPGDYNTLLTRGLSELHPFAVKMLSIDLFRLRHFLETHVRTATAAPPTGDDAFPSGINGAARGLPNRNLQIFYEQVVEAVYPLQQQLVVRDWAGSEAEARHRDLLALYNTHHPTRAGESGSVSGADAGKTLVERAREQRRRRPNTHTSLALSSLKWEKHYAADAVDYDLLVSAEGANSHLRELLDVEGFSADQDFGVRWFLLRTTALEARYVHRWLRRRRSPVTKAAAAYHVQSAHPTSVCLAFPRVEAPNLFSVMAYMPAADLARSSGSSSSSGEGIADEATFLQTYLSDILAADPAATLTRFDPAPILPAPTVFCEQLHNSVGLPSAVLLGDAAHTQNPFWMQSLALALEDGVQLVDQVDSHSRHFYDAVQQYSDERGTCGDALREVTDRTLYYQRAKHYNPLVRLQNHYQRLAHLLLPRRWNNFYDASTNQLYARSVEEMLNGRGYTSYDFVEKQQSKHRMFYHFGRLYT
ncbi:flavoprotein monooxygenase [Strigomonas culicis]|uniref:Flavoprotein monooxygenase n=1 Tax=Strigomonas culicis TaxID=28005 RepID=S9U6R5_9TRYP|nr:flavoprotein monooxygenase [Strigomonas culicis]|eukprot:EPY24484.1 flavoprotein monooxygenase [Strigomonas culicis]